MKSKRPRQQGVVLIVVMIMLVIIGLTSVSVMRNALDADLISNNVRAESLATEAAQIALAFCEQQLTTPSSTLTVQPAVVPGATAHWAVFGNWRGAALATTLTSAQVNSALAATQLDGSRLPQCMAELSGDITGSGRVVIVTARGFSPDYSEDGDGRSLSGSAVWLQSTVRLQ
ncbi:MAG: hypothetical protein Q7V20_07655 [Aquabacterium sp.]|uniref:pilus assembly PilX family protein n=1 Tax=Aquabacterium sp. TaxID=1872578 RepID=UPI00271AE7BB|nr:hypothetical protein [Aquabacterium sp.]MDO9003307.1 hypothetical protein [Aquabacterium sp.]